MRVIKAGGKGLFDMESACNIFDNQRLFPYLTNISFGFQGSLVFPLLIREHVKIEK